MNFRFCIIIFTVFIIIIAKSSFCDFYNHRNHLIGERAALLGGAYTALSEDISGAFYNPAGLVYIKQTSLSMSANVYSYQDFTLKTINSGISYDSEFKKFNIIPTTFGLSLNLSISSVLTLSLFELDRVKFESTAFVDNDNVISELDTDSYLAGPSFAYKIVENFSIGVSVFYHLFQANLSKTINTDLGGGDRQIIEMQGEGSSGGIVPVLGIKWYITPEWQAGLMYSMETIHTNGERSYVSSELNTFTGLADLSQGYVKADIRLPHRIAAGIVYEKRNNFTIAFDVIYYFKLDYNSPRDYLASGDDPDRHYEIAHCDFSLGGELFVTESLALRLGLFTNTSSAPDGVSDGIDLYGGSFGIGHVKDNLSASLGLYIMYGKSDLQTANDGSQAEWERFQIGAIIGSSIKF